MIRILVDSASDFELEELKGKHMEFVPITINFDGKDYRDGFDLKKDQLYEMLEDSDLFPKTSQPSPAEFIDIFRKVKENGDAIICIMISSALSGTYQSAVLAKNMVDYDQIYIIDSLNAAVGIRILVEYAWKLREKGLPAKEIADKAEELKSRIRIMAGVDTLEYLCRGGRLSRTAAAIGELANLKPIVFLSPEGKVEVLGKCLGRLKACSFLLKKAEEYSIDTDFPFYTIYSYGTENIEKMEEKLEKASHNLTGRIQIGATIGAHVGPGAFGFAFVEK